MPAEQREAQIVQKAQEGKKNSPVDCFSRGTLAGGSPYNPLFFNGFCIVLCASHLGNPLIGFPKPFLIFSDDKEFRPLRRATKGFAFGNHNPFEKGLTESFFLRLRSER